MTATTTNNSTPTVSVVLSINNRDAYLAKAIDSVLNQTMQDFELIIVNDGSSNAECLKIIHRYETLDKRIRIIHQENQGLSIARNKGIAVARGQYVALMDDDDISEPQRLERQMAFLDKHPNFDAVKPLMTFIACNGRTLKKEQPPNIGKESAPYAEIGSDHKACLPSVYIYGSSIMARTGVLKTTGYNPLFHYSEDLDLTLRLLEQKHSLACMHEHLYQYRKYGKKHFSHSANPQIILYVLVAYLCALYRQQNKPEPLKESVSIKSLLPLLARLPTPLVEGCLRNMGRKTKRSLYRRQYDDIKTLIANLDTAFLDSEHTPAYKRIRKHTLRKLNMFALKYGRWSWFKHRPNATPL